VRRLGAVALGLGVAAALGARAAGDEARAPGTVVDGEHRYRMVVADGWRPVDAEGTLLAYAGPERRAYMALTRIDLPGRAAWRGDQAFLDSIEAGVSGHTAGYHRASRKLSKQGQVPVMDLRYARDDGGGMTEVATRFVFYRTYALVLAIERAPGDRALERQVDRMLASFEPYAAE
jgi:hypothetical protein